jgi:predicted DNA-binding protein
MAKSGKKRGRPPAGPRGERVSDYPQTTVRLAAETRARLTTLSLLLAQPISRVIDHAIEVYVHHLPESEQKILGPLVERLARGDWPVTSHWAVQWEALEKLRARTRRAGNKPSARR